LTLWQFKVKPPDDRSKYDEARRIGALANEAAPMRANFLETDHNWYFLLLRLAPGATPMKIRLERSGLHCFDRRSGTHILLDEIAARPETWSVAPRTLSIALSNVCDLNCHFCYRPRTKDRLPLEFVKRLAVAADELGTLEITFGGGEPLLYPDLAALCEWIWINTSLGISLTTHGHHLSPHLIRRLAGRICSIRFSIDGTEPYYGKIRGRPLACLLEKIRALDHAIPFGINAVVSPGHVTELRRVADLAIDLGACDLLIIPEHRGGKTLLSSDEWNEIDKFIAEYRSRCRLSVTRGASAHLKANFLETERDDEFVFAHVSADGRLKPNSHARWGIPIRDAALMREYLVLLGKNRGQSDEGLAGIFE
jgi:MoaA/NifB/PqqE/SkfB family radical SAM enzyme